jgi:hypothetical protein
VNANGFQFSTRQAKAIANYHQCVVDAAVWVNVTIGEMERISAQNEQALKVARSSDYTSTSNAYLASLRKAAVDADVWFASMQPNKGGGLLRVIQPKGESLTERVGTTTAQHQQLVKSREVCARARVCV